MATHFAPIFERILDSSINEEPPYVRWLFLTLLVLQDGDNVVRGYNVYKLHRRANLPIEEVEKAIKILRSPDKRYRDQPHDGKRILEVEGGWKIINGEFYQEEMRKIYRRMYNAKKQREYRAPGWKKQRAAVVKSWNPEESFGDEPTTTEENDNEQV
jgi:hypothetical protein